MEGLGPFSFRQFPVAPTKAGKLHSPSARGSGRCFFATNLPVTTPRQARCSIPSGEAKDHISKFLPGTRGHTASSVREEPAGNKVLQQRATMQPTQLVGRVP